METFACCNCNGLLYSHTLNRGDIWDTFCFLSSHSFISDRNKITRKLINFCAFWCLHTYLCSLIEATEVWEKFVARSYWQQRFQKYQAQVVLQNWFGLNPRRLIALVLKHLNINRKHQKNVMALAQSKADSRKPKGGRSQLQVNRFSFLRLCGRTQILF